MFDFSHRNGKLFLDPSPGSQRMTKMTVIAIMTATATNRTKAVVDLRRGQALLPSFLLHRLQ